MQIGCSWVVLEACRPARPTVERFSLARFALLRDGAAAKTC